MTMSIDPIREALAELDRALWNRNMVAGLTPDELGRRGTLVRECEMAVIAAARSALSAQPADDILLAEHHGRNNMRQWATTGTWLMPGESIVHRRAAA